MLEYAVQRSLMTRLPTILVAVATSFVLAACGGSGGGTTTSEPAAGSTTAPATTAAATTETAPATAANGLSTACAKESLALTTPGQLTAATSDPAFPPYVEDNDPTSGKGFESALAYAIAEQLGFTKDEVKWEKVSFEQSFAPGPKKFDFDINQVSINADRQKTVSFSDPYYTAPQSIVVFNDSKLAGATTLAELKDAKLGTQIGTSSLDAANTLIAPTQDVQVYNDTSAATTALKNKQIDGLVVDLPTGLFLAAAELDNAKVIGQFAAPGGDDWGLVSGKDSALTPCLNEALAALKTSGKLDAITTEWMSTSAGAPELK
jgi:polar amino acid transport system substrate-binding protein